MTQLTRDDISSMYFKAIDADDEKLLELIKQNDDLKEHVGVLTRRYQQHKAKCTKVHEGTARKRFAHGQTYMRAKIAKALMDAGLEDAAILANEVHVDHVQPGEAMKALQGIIDEADKRRRARKRK
jgi:hypothetical protein